MEISSFGALARIIYQIGQIALQGGDRRSVIRDIRYLRFDDGGILPLIDAVILGDRKNIDGLMGRLNTFVDYDWHVRDCLGRLIEDCPEISRVAQRQIQEIRRDKTNIRDQIIELLGPLGQARSKIDKRALLDLRSSIVALNLAIDHVEDVLQHGRGV